MQNGKDQKPNIRKKRNQRPRKNIRGTITKMIYIYKD